MSERQEKKKRYNLRLMWIADFGKWLETGLPCGECSHGGAGKKARPVWMEAEE